MSRRAGVVLVLLACLLGPDLASAARYDVTVARTAYGIPHVRAKDYASLGYGYAKSLAQDDVCTVAESYVTVAGERSKFFGADKSYDIRGNGSTANNLNSDFFYTAIRDSGIVDRLAAQQPPNGPLPAVMQVLRGYVDGWNDWLRETGGRDGIPDPTCRGKAWVRPITIDDVLRRFYGLSLLASSGVAIDGIASAQPPAGATRAASSPSAIDAAKAVPAGELDRRLGGLGSNAYAIGKSASQDGHGLLYGNPHFPWQGSERFYEAHLTIPGKLDVTGGSLLGVPIVLIGTTRGMAWSHTVSTARRFVPYQLTLVPGSRTSYVEDGQVKTMTARTVTVDAGGGAMRTRTLYSSEHGPILTSILGLPIFPWTPATAYAMYDSNAENFGRLLNHFFAMNSAQSVEDVDAILRKYQGIPWVNTIASDTAGNAYYADIGNVPDIPQDKYDACLVALGDVTDALQRLPVLDGSRGSCKPGTEPGAAAPGILAPSQQPSLRRDDDVSNMNDSYWLTNPAQPLEGFSRIIGDERTTRSLRTRIGLIQLRERLAGTDGLPGKGFTLDTLTQVAMGNRVYSAELWRDALVAGCTSAACDVLRGWDMRNDLDSKGAVLWQRFATRLIGSASVASASLFSTPFSAANPVGTPSGLNTGNPLVQTSLSQAVSDLQGAGLPLDATLRQGQTVTRGRETIPVHGGPGPNGIFNVTTPTWDPKKGYTEVVHGSSFVQAVHLTPGCPEVRTILTYGESDNPDSIHSRDQTELYAKKGWVTVPFCSSQLEKDRAAQRVHTAVLGATSVAVTEARGKKRPRIRVERLSSRPARIRILVRRGGKVVRRIARRGTLVAVSPAVRRGSYRVEVRVGTRVLRVSAKQR